MIVGSTVFVLGAAIGVPAVFTERDPSRRQQLLESQRTRWVVAQPGYGLGALVAAAGPLALADGPQALFAAAGAVLLAGALAWCWSVYQRARGIPEFAHGLLPSWPFVAYVLMTIAGLALLGAGLLRGRFPGWVGWLTIGADAVFLAAYARFRDIPPFVFYLLLTVVGIAVL